MRGIWVVQSTGELGDGTGVKRWFVGGIGATEGIRRLKVERGGVGGSTGVRRRLVAWCRCSRRH